LYILIFKKLAKVAMLRDFVYCVEVCYCMLVSRAAERRFGLPGKGGFARRKARKQSIKRCRKMAAGRK
jgi:hypothetical protein